MIEGKRFSQLYLDKGIPVRDSVRMRSRLSAVFDELFNSYQNDIAKLIHKETGVKVPYGYSSYIFSDFIEKCDIRDLLDSITLIFQYISNHRTTLANHWHQLVTRVFKEENVGYRLDKKGGVHFFVDEHFERNRLSLIAGLGKHPAVKEALEKAHSSLDQDPPDTSSAVRSIFEALEILYKHIVNAEGKDRLNSMGVKNKLKPRLLQTLVENQIASKAAEHLLDGLCDWIDAGHLYRHGQKVQETLPPPIDLAVIFISQGVNYIRYFLPLADQVGPNK